MTSFVARDVSHLGVDRVATSPTAFALYENLFAFAEGSSGAPKIQTAALDNTIVTQGKMANSAIGQAQLKSTTGEISVAVPNTSDVTLPGGEYGFYPRVRVDSTGTGTAYLSTTNGITWTSYVTNIALGAVNQTTYAQQRYVQASPPYDLGDGEIPLFVFVLVDAIGNIIATYVAPDPPWANNGPTNIRPDAIDATGRLFALLRPVFDVKVLSDPTKRDSELAKLDAQPQLIEITQAVKQADMPLIPHPFMANDLTGKTVVLLDPVAPIMQKLLRLHEQGESIASVLYGDYLRIDNKPLVRSGPSGVASVAVNWKLT